jgi:hypothetical protein
MDNFDNYNQNTYQQPNWHDAYQEPKRGNGFGIASMVLGIVALCLFWGVINIPLGILAIIFAIIHIRRHTGSVGYAVAGIVTSVISFVLTVVAVILFLNFWQYLAVPYQSQTLPYVWDDDEDYDDYDDGDEYIVDPSNPGSLIPYQDDGHNSDGEHGSSHDI